MARRQHGGVGYETAEGWRSRDVVILTRPGSDGRGTNIVMAWEAREPGEALFQHALRQGLRASGQTAGGFGLREITEPKVAGRSSVRTRYVTQGEGGVPLEQIVYWIDCPNGDALSIACTSTESIDATLPVLEKLLASLVFASPESALRGGV